MRTARETLYYRRMGSPVGPLTIVVSEGSLRMIDFGELALPPRDARHTDLVESAERTAPYVSQLEEYFSGRRREFDFVVELHGTDFQKKCWQALMAIPYGETRSYRQMAKAVGCANGFRAVGQANHRNPIPIVVPCHRVIASDGKLAGYGGGLPVKRALLDLEHAFHP